MNNKLLTAILGFLLGFMYVKSGVIEYKYIKGMFLFQDFHMFGFLFTAVGVAAIGQLVLEKMGMKSPNGLAFVRKRRKFHPGLVPGGIMFGIGWALTGACPGTAVAQVGRLYLPAILSFAGLAVGILLYRPFHKKYLPWTTDTCG